MELSDKNEVKTGLVERYSEKFKNISKEQVGCFVEDGYLYAALMFFEEEWRLLELCKVDLDAETLEEVAKALDEVLAKNEFKEKRISLIVPDKFLFEREFILEEKIPETDVKDVVYWDFQEKYFSSKKFGIVCYKLQDMVYKVFALEEKEQKRINEIFEQQNIRISDWMILPKE
ncbi:MAG: hypothetical protein IKN43_11450, partial [Selenomonadaceae bacterium]|nr:hypothetical protein [Selenomonadaceae bacterium]